ncbi:hypothetical protein R8Z50_30230 [Longispora sp. K20-0274]|uniref:hypothetical protein n=1 Tax=Longispora sp. K20-0274 TaxID=3088255 RepID=UPI003999E7B6
MGNAHMYPLLRTTDLGEAFDLAVQLVALATRVQEVSVSAMTAPEGLARYLPLPELAGRPLHTSLRIPPQQAQSTSRLLEHLPSDRFSWSSTGSGWVWDLTPAEAKLIDLIPDLVIDLDLDLDKVVPGRVEEQFIASAGSDIGELSWSVIWPESAREDLWSIPKYDGVELVIHETGLFSEKWSDTHSVWVCGRSETRAEWAAQATGRTVVGAMELGR